MKVLLLSRYSSLGSSSRYRFYQYLPYLRQQGFSCTIAPLLDDDYLLRMYNKQRASFVNILRSYTRRFFQLLHAKTYDVIWLEKEAFPWLFPWVEWLVFRSGKPCVVDYDDAWFHRYDQHKSMVVRTLLGKRIDFVMRHATLVIAGNQYLADRARIAGSQRIEIIPTVVDLDRYPHTPIPDNAKFTIGWIGSPSTSCYLKDIELALRSVCQDYTAHVVAVGSEALELFGVPLEVKTWNESSETQELQQFDVGIMPLPNTPWERGKCGFKLIQYMASGRPVIASPVGVNQEIVVNGMNGLLANSQTEWIDGFQQLKRDKALRQRMGNMGRKMVEEHYCLQVTAPKIAQILRMVA